MYEVQSTKYQVWIRFLTQIVLLRDLACLPQAGYMVLCTWYLIHGTWYLVDCTMYLLQSSFPPFIFLFPE